MRIVQISDTHLSDQEGLIGENFERLVDFVNAELGPDLVVSSGDLSLLDPDNGPDRAAAQRGHQRLGAPLRVLPGNHDVGEPGPDPWMGRAVTSARLAAFRRVFGPDHWIEERDGWVVLGLNSEVLSSGLPEEDEQWEWLEGTARRVAGRSVLLFLHRPLWPTGTVAPDHVAGVSPADRDRIVALLGPSLRAVASGHLHRFSSDMRGDVLTVTAPSTAFLVGPHLRHGTALDQLGVVEYQLDEGVRAYFRAPTGLDERVLGEVPEVEVRLGEMSALPG